MSGITRHEIAAQLRRLGAGDCELLLVHSSLSSFGHVLGGAATVAGALLDTAGAGGSIFVPTFNFGQLAFDAVTTPSLTGAISERVRLLPGALRSTHPTHSVSGIGPQARRVLRSHPLLDPFGNGSPIWQLWKENAGILLLGCDHQASSVIHVAEVLKGVPYLNRTRIGRVIEAGNQREIIVARPPCSRGFNVVDAPLRRDGKLQESMIGPCRVLLMRAVDVVSAALELLQSDPGELLCDNPQCVACPEARELLG